MRLLWSWTASADHYARHVAIRQRFCRRACTDPPGTACTYHVVACEPLSDVLLMSPPFGLLSSTRYRPTRTSTPALTSILGLLLITSGRNWEAGASRFTHHKAAKPAVNSITSRNASYASNGSGAGSGWASSIDNPFKMDRPLNVFGRPLGQCGTDPVTGFYRDGVGIALEHPRYSFD